MVKRSSLIFIVNNESEHSEGQTRRADKESRRICFSTYTLGANSTWHRIIRYVGHRSQVMLCSGVIRKAHR